MKKNIIVIFLVLTKLLMAQDTIRYSQKDASLFSNRYFFYSEGRFEHFFNTDDSQKWYGKGTYHHFLKWYILRFETIKPKIPQVKMIPHTYDGFTYIRIFELEGEDELPFWFWDAIKIKNSIDNQWYKYEDIQEFQSNSDTTFRLRVPNTLFKGLTRIHIPRFSSIIGETFVEIDSIEVNKGVEIHIYVDESVYYIAPKTEILIKKRNYLQMPDRYHTVKKGRIKLVPF